MSTMDPGTIEMGPRYGCHGQYTFYKAFRYLIPGRWVTVSKGKFFFVNSRSSSNDLSLCIGEIQLIWTTRSEPQDPLSSVRLYFMPEHSPEGRKQYHGEDELLAAEDKIIIRVKDLISWLVTEGVSWSAGYVFPAVLYDEPTGTQLVDCPVVITSYSKYCRLMSLEKRIESIMPSPEKAIYAFAVRAVCGIADLTSQTRIMFCRETFRHRDLEDHELRCDHLAPNLKGRPRSRHRVKTLEAAAGDHEYVPLNALLPKPKRGRPRKGVLSEAILRAEGPFLKAVYSFMKERGTPIHRIPSIGFKKIDLFVFYKTAEKLGGYKQICMKRSWKKLHDKIGGNPSSTSAATCTRKHYERLLLPFEEHVRSCKSNKTTNLVSSKCLADSLATRPKLVQSACKPLTSSTYKGPEHGKAAELRPGGMLPTPSLVAAADLATSSDVDLSCAEQCATARTASSQLAEPQCQSGKRQRGEQSGLSRLPTAFSSVKHSDASRESWSLTRRPASARPLPPPPPLLADVMPSADRRSHDSVTRTTESYLEGALRYSDMTPTVAAAAAAAEGMNRQHEQQQQQQRLFVPIFPPYHGGTASYNGSRPAVQSPDGRYVVTASSAVQFLPSSHEQLISAKEGVVNAGLLFAGDLQRSHLRKPEVDIATCAMSACPSQQPRIVAGARGGALPLQYSLCIDGKLTSVVGKQQHPYFTAVIGTDAHSDMKTTGSRIQTSVTTSDRPLDLTCKTPLRPWTATVMPAILSGSRARKQPTSSGKPNAGVVVVTSAGGSAVAAAVPTAVVVPALHSTTTPAKVEFEPGKYECRASPPRLPSDSTPLQKNEALIVRHAVLDGFKSSQLSILSGGRASDSDVVSAVTLSSQQAGDAVLYRSATHTVLPSTPSSLVMSSSSTRHTGLPTHQGKQTPLLPQHLVRSLMTRSQN